MELALHGSVSEPEQHTPYLPGGARNVDPKTMPSDKRDST